MEPELKIYTIADLRSWLIVNNPPAGLSEQVIAPVRAYAILNNPYVKDDDAVAAAIYEGDELAAFTACFPDMYEEKRIWWCSTLYCDPKFQGQGYGMIVVGSLMEAHEPDLTFDRWGAQETVEIFKCLGYNTTYTSRYWLTDKMINRDSLKGYIAYSVQNLCKMRHRKQLSIESYSLKYSNFIDGEAYGFMKLHQNQDWVLREQQMLNWLLQNPFVLECDLPDRVIPDCAFTSNVRQSRYRVVKVYAQGCLVGVYILRNRNKALGVLYIYADTVHANLVYHSIAEYIYQKNIDTVSLECKALFEYLHKNLYFPKHYVEQVSVSVPDSVNFPSDYTMQMGDGDSFA